jgi:ATP-binding cassette, subfamily F, member 3
MPRRPRRRQVARRATPAAGDSEADGSEWGSATFAAKPRKKSSSADDAPATAGATRAAVTPAPALALAAPAPAPAPANTATAEHLRAAYDAAVRNADGDDLDDFGSAWEQVKAEGKGWGGRGFGGRSLRISNNERDVSIDSLTLAYEGNVLLNRTTLLLKRGVRYGLIGANGCGKSTLMRRLARYAIPGFPLGLSVAYVDQELRQLLACRGDDTSSALDLLAAFAESGAAAGGAKSVEALQAEQLELEEIDDPDEGTIERLCDIAEQLDQVVGGGGVDAAGRENGANSDALLKHLVAFGFSKHMATAVPIAKLSGGWKMRLALLVAILSKPDILLLDEPTNHLDLDGVLWLQQALQKKEGARRGHGGAGSGGGVAELFSRDDLTIVIVSHDRAFLDGVVGEIVSFEFKRLTYHPGNYSSFANARSERRANKQRLLDNRNKKISSAEKSFAKHTQGQSLKRTTKGYDPKKEKQAASQRKKALERAGNYLDNGKRFKKNSLQKLDAKSDLRPTTISANDRDFVDPRTLVFKFPRVDRTSLRLASAETSAVFSMESVKSLGYEDAGANYVPILQSVTLSVSLSSRIAVVGPNGAGKTTLLRLVGGDAGPVIVKAGSSGSVTSHRQLRRALMNQHHIASLESMMELSSVGVMQRHRRATQGTGLTAGAARQLLGGFGLPGDLALMPISLLSGGQKARLSMACAVNHTPHLLALDEPTNHLDVSSRAALIAALGEFNGGIVLVSHDAHFLKQVCNELWIVKDGRVRVVKGNFARAFDTYCAPKKVREKKAASGGQRRQHVARGRFD